MRIVFGIVLLFALVATPPATAGEPVYIGPSVGSNVAYSIAIGSRIERWFPSSHPNDALSDAEKFMRKGDYKQAVEAWENAEIVWENDTGATAQMLRYIKFQLAEAERLCGRPENSIRLLKELEAFIKPKSSYGSSAAINLSPNIERSLDQDTQVNLAAIYHAYAAAYQMLADYDMAADVYERAFYYLVRRGHAGTMQASVILRSQAELYRVIGDLERAESYLSKAYSIRLAIVGETGTALAPIFRTFASILLEQWELGKATNAIEKAINLDYEEYGLSHPEMAADFEAAAILLWRQGRYTEAADYFDRAGEIRWMVLGTGHPETAWSDANQAEFFLDIGMADEAWRLNERALRNLEDVYDWDHVELAAVRFNLARSELAAGVTIRAIDDIEIALKAFRRVYGEKHPWTLEALSEFARITGESGDWDTAVVLAKEAVAARIKHQGESHPEVAKTLRILAKSLRNVGKSREAIDIADRAIAIDSEQLGWYHPETARSLWERIISIVEHEKTPVAASRDYAEYITTMITILSTLEGADGIRFEEFRNNVERWATLLAATAPSDSSGDTLRAESLREWDRLLWIRTRYTGIEHLSPNERKAYLEIEDIRHYAEAIDAELNLKRRSGGLNAEDEFERINTIRTLWSRYARLRAEFFEERDPELWAAMGISATSWRTLASRLSPGECYMRLATGDSATLIYLVTPNRLLFHRSEQLGRENLHRRIAFVRELVSTPPELHDADEDILTSTMEKLYEELFGEEIGTILARSDKVHIAPSGSLYYLPFETLDPIRDGDYQPWGVTVTLDYIANPATSYRPVHRNNSGALLYANPTLSSSDAPSLAGAKVEAELISEIIAGSKLRSDSAAKKTSLSFDLHTVRPDVLVISAHAQAAPLLTSEDPWSWQKTKYAQEGARRRYFLRESAIFLAPHPERGDSWGVLTLDEILDMRPESPPNLVVLSACQTAVGDFSAGDEVMHLAEAFRGMGASHVLATLWSVNDYASARLVVTFFDYRSQGMSEEQALRLAKRDLWKREDRYQHPYYWAGYILYRPVF